MELILLSGVGIAALLAAEIYELCAAIFGASATGRADHHCPPPARQSAFETP
jgi:hypothetical protein